MLSTLTRLNGKRLARNYNPKQRLECQFCHKTVRTKKLDFDVVCPHCGNYAKKSDQELITVTKFDKTRKQHYVFYCAKYPITKFEAVYP